MTMGSERASAALTTKRNFLPSGATSQFREVKYPPIGTVNKAAGSPGRNTGAVETGSAVCRYHPLVRGFSVWREETDVDFPAAAGIGHIGDKSAAGREPSVAFAAFGVDESFSF